MKEYFGYKYQITARSDGRYDFEVWEPGVDVKAPAPEMAVVRRWPDSFDPRSKAGR